MSGRLAASHSPPAYYSVCSPWIIHRPRYSVKPRDLPLSSSNLNLLSSKSPTASFTCSCTRDSGTAPLSLSLLVVAVVDFL